MQIGQQASPRAQSDLVSAVAELMQSTSQALVLVTTGTIMAGCFLVAGLSGDLSADLLFPAAITLAGSALSLWSLPRNRLAGQVAWQTGLALSMLAGIQASRQPEAIFALAFLPLVAAVTIGWPAGLAADAVVAGLCGWLAHSSAMPPVPAGYGVATVMGGAFAVLLAWAAMRTFLATTEWSLLYYEEAYAKTQEARDQRLELKQVQEDLILANRELARVSDRLRAMHQIAEEARRAKEEFVANVSHELRTPLNMIIGFSEMITEAPQVYGDKLPPALLSDITAIQRNSQHLSRLVDDVLDLSQVDAGRMALSKEWSSVREIVQEGVEVVEALFASKGLSLAAEVAGDLPLIFCDSVRIRQVLINLLSNVGRFTEKGGVRISAECSGADVRISVADTGPGISPEDQRRVFEPFRQLDGSIRRRHGGSGLGLAISKRFVEMHGGRMWLESEVGVGTTFHFCLPAGEPSLPDTAGDVRQWFGPYVQYEARTRRSKAPLPRPSPRFVLLDSGDALPRIFGRYLGDVEIVAVHDIAGAMVELGRSAAQALVVNAPAALDGVARSDALASLPYGIPAVTCWLPGSDEAARRLGVVRYLVKPVTRQVLLSTLIDLGDCVRTVLLVDDEPEALQLFSRMLDSADRSYGVLLARSGQRALALLREHRPDVVLLDLVMPGMDGYRLLQEKQQDPSVRDIPVVVVSSRDPGGEPLASDTLTVTRAGGLPVRELVACIRAVSEVLVPAAHDGERGQLQANRDSRA